MDMKSIDGKHTSLQRILPSPFSLAVILTFLTFLLAVFFGKGQGAVGERILAVFGFWDQGFWELLKFAMQMMLMLVLGSMLAQNSIFGRLMDVIIPIAKTSASAALWVSAITIILAYLNWGLALIFGALLARKVGERFVAKGMKLNYPLIGAAAYSGLMVWHGGLSGSAPLKIAEQGHFLEDKIGIIPVTETLFSSFNIIAFFLVISLIPLLFYFLGKRKFAEDDFILPEKDLPVDKKIKNKESSGLETSRIFALSIGLFMLLGVVVMFVSNHQNLNINSINLLLFSLALLSYKNLTKFNKSASKSIAVTTGIMLQFPLYAGIMGMMKYSGLTDVFTQFFIDISNTDTFPLFTMLSAGIVNFFVPSGGGQWAIQGPVIVEAAQQLNVPVSKAVMALAYGDQLTNMMQPFWALPLLAITGLKARQILPYSIIIMVVGALIFGGVLLWF